MNTTTIRGLLGTLFLCLATALTWAQPVPPSNLEGESLKSWLKANYFDGRHNTLGYTAARRYMYNYIDNKNNTITGVYSGYQVSWQAGGTGTNPAPINCEHVVPQSFFGQAEPMKSDIHHLFPTYQNWNSTRSNHPFAEIPDNQTAKWMYLSNDQTSIPSNNIDSYSEYYASQFEPREDHKGNIARAVFYFYTMYPTQAGNISSVGDLNTLYQWHLADPVDAAELERNAMIENYQGDRNPYIDYPNAVARAWGFTPVDGGGATGGGGGSSCVGAEVTLSLTFDNYPSETAWALTNSQGATVISGNGSGQSNGSSISEDLCLEDGSYTFTITDTYGDGICCAYGNGGFSIVSNGATLVDGGSFGSSDSQTFTIGSGSGGSTGGGGGSLTASELIISEYIEGSSYNKAIEIANFTGTAVNLSSYALAKQANGSGSWSTLSLSGTLNNGETYVIAHSSASSTLRNKANLTTTSSAINFNGNDAVSLMKNGQVIDILSAFNSAAVYGQNVTLVRKSSVTSPSTTYNTNEWTALSSNDFSNTGTHTLNSSARTATSIAAAVETPASPIMLTVYPNPATDIANLSFEAKEGKEVQVMIMSMDGRQVYNETLMGDGYSTDLRIEVGSYQKGLYLVRVQTGNQYGVYKLLVQ